MQCYNDEYITTTDGRYEQEYPYFNIAFVKKDGSLVEMVQVPYSLLDFPTDSLHDWLFCNCSYLTGVLQTRDTVVLRQSKINIR